MTEDDAAEVYVGLLALLRGGQNDSGVRIATEVEAVVALGRPVSVDVRLGARKERVRRVEALRPQERLDVLVSAIE